MTDTSPHGSWPSPITAEAVAAASPRLDGARFVGDEVWWSESVPAEGGRMAVRRLDAAGEAGEVLPAPWNARSRVHEYGGGAWTATDDGVLVFVNLADQRVWRLDGSGEPLPLTPEDGGMRFGGLSWQGGQGGPGGQDGRLLAIRETHAPRSGGAARGPLRDIVEIPLDGSAVWDEWAIRSVVDESDFVAQPALSPDGARLAWIAWNHPNMPWDAAELRVGPLQDGVVTTWTTVAGGASSPLQPVWLGVDDLLYSDDPTGRWNLWRLRLGSGQQPEQVAAADADTGGGLWVLGSRWFARLDDGRVLAVRTNGRDELVLLAPGGEATPVPLDVVWDTTVHEVRGTRALVSGAGAAGPTALWLIDVDDPGAAVRVAGGETPWGETWIPRARAVSFEGDHGPVHAFDYPPANPQVTAPDGELPPYVVFVHGGPTSHVGGAASPRISYLTSRGIGVLDVNYAGSTGYGRAYRERLRAQWGIADVDDVIAAARGLAATGAADPARLAIAGGSAGGWTVLCALAGSDVFGAGIDRYGVADLRLLAAETHDFEARYLDGLVGPLPEAEAVYVQRSPLSRLDSLRTPLLILQGLDDEVVPPSQSEAVRDALAARGVPHAYLTFEGEGHGFRRAETLVRAIEAEYAFLGQVFGFETPGVEPIALA